MHHCLLHVRMLFGIDRVQLLRNGLATVSCYILLQSFGKQPTSRNRPLPGQTLSSVKDWIRD